MLSDQSPAPDAPSRVSLKFVKAKFQPGALKEFLLKPEQHYQWIKMPDFRLSDDEGDALVALLRSRKSPELKDDVSGDPKRGKELFQSSGCLSCHSMKLENSFKAKPLAQLSDWTRGCVAGDASRRGNAPDFSLNDEQRASLLSLAATNFESLRNKKGMDTGPSPLHLSRHRRPQESWFPLRLRGRFDVLVQP